MKGLVCLITGGGNGLGKAVVEMFLRLGSKVVICDLASSNGQEINKSHPENSIFCATDVTSEKDVKECLTQTESKFGKLDVVVNCAGIGPIGNLFNFKTNVPHDFDKFKNVMDVNATGTFNVIRLAIDLMRKNVPDEDGGRGVIVNTSSVMGFEATAGVSAYAASKGAVLGMTLPMARDLSYVGIRVMAIAPGYFETNMTAGMREESQKVFLNAHAFPKRSGKPQEFAKLVVAIVENPMLNGTVIRIDAGVKVPPMFNQ